MSPKSLRILLVPTFAFAAAAAAADPLPACTDGDTRTPVPTWQPTVDDKGFITTEPPQQPGQVVHIRAHYAPADLACDDATLHPLAHRNSDGTPGGLSVNLKGHATAVDGACSFDGFYRNEEVPGMHQGWIETYFGAVPAGEVTATTYCLATATD